MATLLEELRSLLPELLPATPEEALMGTELVQRITQRLPGRKESSVRQYLSALAKDPTSPIARVDGGYGYYRRSDSAVPEPAPVTPMSAPDPRQTTDGPGVQARDQQREERFRAFVFRNALYEDRFPFIVEHTRGSRGDAGANRWKYPDLVVADWDVGEPDPTGFRLDKSLLEVKRGLGEQPFRLTSMELKTELTLTKVRESFFQCVSNSKWAHHAELAIAEPLTDAVLTEELRRLGAAYGVSVTTYGFQARTWDTLPAADELRRMQDEPFGDLLRVLTEEALLATSALVVAPPRDVLDWEYLRDMRKLTADFRSLFRWRSHCLRDGKAYTYDDFRSLEDVKKRYDTQPPEP